RSRLRTVQILESPDKYGHSEQFPIRRRGRIQVLAGSLRFCRRRELIRCLECVNGPSRLSRCPFDSKGSGSNGDLRRISLSNFIYLFWISTWKKAGPWNFYSFAFRR